MSLINFYWAWIGTNETCFVEAKTVLIAEKEHIQSIQTILVYVYLCKKPKIVQTYYDCSDKVLLQEKSYLLNLLLIDESRVGSFLFLAITRAIRCFEVYSQ